jgi:branched-chain amino acid transport system substrate-binding protein
LFFVDPQTPAKAGIIVKQLQEAGLKGPFMFNDVSFDSKQEVIEPYKDYIEGSVGALVPYDKANPELATLQAAYKVMANGEDLPYVSYMAPTYDTLYILKEAIEKVGFDSEKIKNYLYTVKGRKGLAGTLSFDANGDPTAEYRHAVKVLKNGVAEDYVE